MAAARSLPATHLQLVLVLVVDPGEQLGLAAVQRVDEGVTLRHQTRLELHPVLLRDKHTGAGTAAHTHTHTD